MTLDYRPSFPARPGPIALIGCGAAAKELHLPAYEAWHVDVAGVYDANPAATDGVRQRVYGSLEDLLADPDVVAVDIATRPVDRAPLIRQSLEAGKHVLSQKPLAVDLETARALVELADRLGLRLAVNQNGRWAPQWRAATLLVQEGAVGDVFAVTHLHDKHLPPLVGTHFDELEHFVLYDYDVHWIDISRCWLEHAIPAEVRAWDYRTPDQPDHARSPWAAVVEIRYAGGENVLIRTVGEVRTARPGALFWIHGTEGTIRGSVTSGAEFLELDTAREVTRLPLEGAWYPDGMAGTLAELLSAIDEEREPYNSARHNLLSLELTLAACRSADLDGAAVTL